MNAPQIITTPAGDELVVIPKADYEALLQAAEEAWEDASDVAIYDAVKAEFSLDGVLPADVSMALLQGESRIKALRKWRGFTQQELASKAEVTQDFLSDLEARRRSASAATVDRLAAALDVPRGWLE